MPPAAPAYNVDWVWSSDSNIHVATHRDWFTTFAPLTSQITSAHDNTTYAVQGIGSVEVEVRRVMGNVVKRNLGPKNTTITLRNVLFVPDFICNVMGTPVRDDYDISIGAERWIMDKKTGRGLGMLDKNPAGLVKILLKGQAKGETGLKGDVPQKITVEWSDQEKKKWDAQKEAEKV